MIILLIEIIILILCVILSIYSIQKLNQANNINCNKQNIIQEQQEYLQTLKLQIEDTKQIQQQIYQQYLDCRKKYQEELIKIQNSIQKYKYNLAYGQDQYLNQLEQTYLQKEQFYDTQNKKFEQQIQNYKNQIITLKNSLSAGVQAQLREKEKNEQLNFYKLKINQEDLDDIIILNKIKISLHQPIILSKLIWSTYFQKQTIELCNRIIGINKVCGIYKITNIKTQQCYIGQSVDVAARIKDHIRAGLGIDASATNKLYNNMQEDGVWNFTFELLEKCPREQLNEKEKFWIDMYQSNLFGFNSTKGNK